MQVPVRHVQNMDLTRTEARPWGGFSDAKARLAKASESQLKSQVGLRKPAQGRILQRNRVIAAFAGQLA